MLPVWCHRLALGPRLSYTWGWIHGVSASERRVSGASERKRERKRAQPLRQRCECARCSVLGARCSVLGARFKALARAASRVPLPPVCVLFLYVCLFVFVSIPSKEDAESPCTLTHRLRGALRCCAVLRLRLRLRLQRRQCRRSKPCGSLPSPDHRPTYRHACGHHRRRRRH